MNLRTLNDVFFTLVKHNSDGVMLTREGDTWRAISARQLQSWVYATARQLQSWGIHKGDRVVLLSENRPEWAVADFACLMLQCPMVDVSGYTSVKCQRAARHDVDVIALLFSHPSQSFTVQALFGVKRRGGSSQLQIPRFARDDNT